MGAKVELRRWAEEARLPREVGGERKGLLLFEDSDGDFHLIIACS